ncbi:MAG: glycine--tRNA ligase subunit beta [Chlamydiales bacterium]|nr:glycine--tRNA ligase subunit beta [Chlamydiales bacterium]
MLTFQEVVNRLTQFWMDQGCVIQQGHDVETGAGTFNPATFLRALGPEPYSTVYVEPSRRPQDGRYGQNPNRVFLFHQLQVIIKPSKPDIQQLYLDSLAALGLNLAEHDIRFVHDDWEAPTQGAWGLGWEVWIDGMEATQFTYFQSVGSTSLKPICVELAYGLERLCMYLQNVDNIFDVKWNDHLTLGDISKQNEEQWSAYNFEHANVKMWKRHFDDYEKEAEDAIKAGVCIPAYDFVIKASHAFNMLDARGVISPTERTGYIARIRDLSAQIADAYLTLRQKLGYPLMPDKQPFEPLAEQEIPAEKNPEKCEDFLLELGSEQLPAAYVDIGAASLRSAFEKLLNEHELAFDSLAVYGTPRRLSVFIKNLKRSSPSKTVEKRGPAIASAFGNDGEPTLQGLGFLKSIGLEEITIKQVRSGKIPGLEVRTIKNQEYLFATLSQEGLSTAEIIAKNLPKLISGLHFPKKMRWSNFEIEYPRPLHWIVCIHGKKVIPFSFGPIQSGRTSFGHAQLDNNAFDIKEAEEYVETLYRHKIIVDYAGRKKAITEQLSVLEKETNCTALHREKLLKEVVNLVEWPQLAIGSFDEKFLRAPKDVLISEMVQHQRYFPLLDQSGCLKNQFIITADNTPSELIIKGNQKVLSARLSDGLFLYDQDRKVSLETHNEKLKTIVFQKNLGSMLDKVLRLEKHATLLANTLKNVDAKKAAQAAHLCKADLSTLLVGEFPELQGTIGRDYALLQNIDPEIAAAIEEHWMPRQEGAPLPPSALGQIVSLADKIDNLLGYFSVGLKPTSSSDPYACRRTAIGLIKILVDEKLHLNLQETLTQAAAHFAHTIQAETIDDVLQYITMRAKGVFEDKGYQKDEIEASLQGLCQNPYDQFRRITALHHFRKSEHFNHLFEVYKRAKGQLESKSFAKFNPQLLVETQEKTLYAHLSKMIPLYDAALRSCDYKAVFDQLATLRAPLSELFNHVKILAEDPATQQNRLALLHEVFSLFEPLLDFSKIQVEAKKK